MEDIVINHVPSNTASPKDIVIDLMPTPPFTAASSARFYWRPESEPETPFEELAKATIGFDAAVPFEGKGEIRISMIGIAANGVPSTYDPREGVQTVFTMPGVFDNVLTDGGEILTDGGEILEDLY